LLINNGSEASMEGGSVSSVVAFMFRYFALPLYFALVDTVMIVCFFVIGIMIRRETSKNNVTFSSSIGDHLKSVCSSCFLFFVVCSRKVVLVVVIFGANSTCAYNY